MTKRRRILRTLGLCALAFPPGTFAQRQKIWRIGYLSPRPSPSSLDAGVYGAFQEGLRDLGYVEGANLLIERRWGDGHYERLPGLAAELVRLNVDLILATSSPAVGAAQKATGTIPIVMGNADDPVESGFIQSLARPGGNITGLASIRSEIVPKHVQLLRELVPTLDRVAVLMNPTYSVHTRSLAIIKAAAQAIKLKVLPVEAKTKKEIDHAFSMIANQSAGAIIILGDSFFLAQTRQIASLAVHHRLPSIYSARTYARDGGLLSYGENLPTMFRRAASYVDKMFKGAKPAELPVEQATNFELVINLQTARAIGITIPQSILLRTDEVIQ